MMYNRRHCHIDDMPSIIDDDLSAVFFFSLLQGIFRVYCLLQYLNDELEIYQKSITRLFLALTYNFFLFSQILFYACNTLGIELIFFFFNWRPNLWHTALRHNVQFNANGIFVSGVCSLIFIQFILLYTCRDFSSISSFSSSIFCRSLFSHGDRENEGLSVWYMKTSDFSH